MIDDFINKIIKSNTLGNATGELEPESELPRSGYTLMNDALVYSISNHLYQLRHFIFFNDWEIYLDFY